MVTAPVLAQGWQGGPRQANLSRMLAGCDVEARSAGLARRVGEIAGRADHDDVIEVAVVEGAVRRGGDVVVTSNADHIRQVAAGAGSRLRIERV